MEPCTRTEPTTLSRGNPAQTGRHLVQGERSPSNKPYLQRVTEWTLLMITYGTVPGPEPRRYLPEHLSTARVKILKVRVLPPLPNTDSQSWTRSSDGVHRDDAARRVQPGGGGVPDVAFCSSQHRPRTGSLKCGRSNASVAPRRSSLLSIDKASTSSKMSKRWKLRCWQRTSGSTFSFDLAGTRQQAPSASRS